MLTVFERIPDQFVQHYDGSFQVWAREFRRRGHRAAIPFDPVPGVPAILDANGVRVTRGAWFEAEVDRSGPVPRVVIRPADDAAAEAIEKHTREMSRYWAQ